VDLAYNLLMKKTFGRIILLILTISSFSISTYATSYQEEVQTIDQAFFQASADKKKTKPIRQKTKKRTRGETKLGDLEQKFFQDSVSTGAAAPTLNKSRKIRSR
tara:strand:+ start:5525 stop:5836 length:312 start_codon:yes stop_codon:yes gene_type:complete